MSSNHKIDKTKTNTSLLWKYEQKWIAWAVPKVPQFINGRNLTWATAYWSILVVLAGWLTKYSIHWIWGISALIVAQYITDSLDGALGRYRNSGLINWGHYVDHFLDFIFLCAIIISYVFIIPEYILFLLILLVLLGAHYVSTYLAFSYSKEFRMGVSGVSMNFLKIGLIVINACIVFWGTGFMKYLLMTMTVLAFVALYIVVYSTQREAEEFDEQNRKNSDQANEKLK